MTPLVVIVNGPAGVGKSSIAPRVAARAPNAACIAGDDLKRFVIRRSEPPTVQLGLAYVGAAALTDVFLAAGYDLVVVDFVFERPRHIRRYADSLRTPVQGLGTHAAGVQILALTLWAPLEVVRRRHERRARPGRRHDSADRSRHDDADRSRHDSADRSRHDEADRSWHAIAEHLDELGAVVDAGGTIEQTLAAVPAHVDPHLAR